MSYTDIHPDAFKTEAFNSYEYPARLVVSEARPPSQRLVDALSKRVSVDGSTRPIPKTVWYQQWQQLDRPAAFDTERELVPPLQGGELRNSKLWQHTLESFQKIGVVITSPADFKKVEGKVFQIRRGDLNTGTAQRPFIISNVVTPLRQLSEADVAGFSTNGTAPVDDELPELLRNFIQEQLGQEPMEWSALEAVVTEAFNYSGDAQIAQTIRDVMNNLINEDVIGIAPELRGKLKWQS